MKQSPADALYVYWTLLRGDALAPRRFDIEPSRIVPILPHTFILEKLAPADYRYRIAGTAICEAFGLEMRDTSFLAGWSAIDRASLKRSLAVVTRRGGVTRFTVEAARAGHPAPVRPKRRPAAPDADKVIFDGILLPLVHTKGAIDRVLGALAPREAPDWLGLDPLGAPVLTSLAIEWPRLAEPEPPSLADDVSPEDDLLRRLHSPGARPRPAAAEDRPPSGRPNIAELHSDERQAPFIPHIRKSRIVRSDGRQFRVYDGGLGKRED